MAQIPRYEAQTPIINAVVPSKAPVYGEIAKSAFVVSQVIERKHAQEKKQKMLLQKELLDSDLAKNLNKFYMDSRVDPDAKGALDSFNVAAKSYTEKLLETTPKNLRPIIKRNAVRYIDSAQLKIQSRILQQREDELQLDFYNNIKQKSDLMSNVARDGTDPNAAIQSAIDIKNNIKHGVDAGFISPATGANIDSATYKDLHRNLLIGQYNNATTIKEKNSIINKIKKSKKYDKIFSADERDRILSSFQKSDLTGALVQRYGVATFGDLKKKIIFDAQHGKTLKGEDLAFLEQVYPKRFPELAVTIQNNEAIGSIVDSVKIAGVEDMHAKIAELSLPQNNNTYRKNLIATTATHLIQDNIKMLKNDPIQYLEGNEKLKEIRVQEAFKRKTNNPTAKSDAEVKINFQLGMGIAPEDIKIQMAEHDAADIASINNASIPDGIKFLEEKEKEYPNTFNTYMKGITGRNGINHMYSTAYEMSKNPKTAGQINYFVNAMSIETGELNKQYKNATQPNILFAGRRDADLHVSDIEKTVSSQTYALFHALRLQSTRNEDLISSLDTQFSKLAKYYVVAGLETKPDKAVTRAYNAIIGNRYHEMTSEEKYIVPLTVNKDQLKSTFNRIDKMIEEEKIKPNLIRSMYPVSNKLKQVRGLKTFINTGYWTNFMNDNKWIRVDALSYPVTIKGKIDYVAKDEIADIDSTINEYTK